MEELSLVPSGDPAEVQYSTVHALLYYKLSCGQFIPDPELTRSRIRIRTK
jgi:hypothetical protein